MNNGINGVKGGNMHATDTFASQIEVINGDYYLVHYLKDDKGKLIKTDSFLIEVTKRDIAYQVLNSTMVALIAGLVITMLIVAIVPGIALAPISGPICVVGAVSIPVGIFNFVNSEAFLFSKKTVRK